ncbi:hypothetical protein FRC12_020403 [Ceratobasidium sp. 428]|nr:hypothetical protein FRC12_020403 [Ceratobasidium sp. 428]
MKHGTSQVELPLPTPTPSPPIRVRPRPRQPPAPSSSHSPPPRVSRDFQTSGPPSDHSRERLGTAKSISGNESQLSRSRHGRVASSLGDRSRYTVEDGMSADEDSDGVEVIEEDEEDCPDDGTMEDDESEEDSEDESDLSGSGRMRASIYVDCSAREVKGGRSKYPAPAANPGGQDMRWTGASQGVLTFRKRPNTQGLVIPGRWTFSKDGVLRQLAQNREIGDIHFSPAYSGEPGFEYWVCVSVPKQRWAPCLEGQAHPTLTGYVLRASDGVRPPQWILAQSLRANLSRGQPRLS